jgi:hypothetical protein
VEVIVGKGGTEVDMEVKYLQDEVMTLRMAIEEAIMKGQKSFGALGDIAESHMTSDEELDPSDMNGGSGVVGWIDDF